MNKCFLWMGVALAGALALTSCRPLHPTAGTAPLANESLTAGVSRSQHVYGTRPFEVRSAGEKMGNDIADLIGPADRIVRVDLIGLQNASSLPEASFRPLKAQLLRTLRSKCESRGIELRSVTSRAQSSGLFELSAYFIGGVRPGGQYFVDWTLVRR